MYLEFNMSNKNDFTSNELEQPLKRHNITIKNNKKNENKKKQ